MQGAQGRKGPCFFEVVFVFAIRMKYNVICAPSEVLTWIIVWHLEVFKLPRPP